MVACAATSTVVPLSLLFSIVIVLMPDFFFRRPVSFDCSERPADDCSPAGSPVSPRKQSGELIPPAPRTSVRMSLPVAPEPVVHPNAEYLQPAVRIPVRRDALDLPAQGIPRAPRSGVRDRLPHIPQTVVHADPEQLQTPVGI